MNSSELYLSAVCTPSQPTGPRIEAFGGNYGSNANNLTRIEIDIGKVQFGTFA